MECPNNYHMVQISNEGNIDEIDKFLVICQNFPTKYFYYLAIANVASWPALSIFFIKLFSIPIHQYFLPQKFVPYGMVCS